MNIVFRLSIFHFANSKQFLEIDKTIDFYALSTFMIIQFYCFNHIKMNSQTDKEKNLLLYILILIFSNSLLAQHTLNRLDIRSGVSVGSPIIIKDIPEGATGRPGIGLNVGLEYTRTLFSNFSLTIGGAFAQKKSRFSSPVSGRYDATRGVFGERFPFPLRVKYTGDVTAVFEMTFLDFPVLVNYHLPKWRVGLGYQYSKMIKGTLNGEVNVKALLLNFREQPFDESKNIKDSDHSAILKVSRYLGKRWSFSADVIISAQRLLIEPEEGLKNPRNVFANLLIAYRLY